MQGHRGIGSFTETIDVSHGSASSTSLHPQICWNDVQNAGDNRLPNYMVAPDDIGVTYVDPTGQERQTASRLSFGGPSSSSTQNVVRRDDQKTEHIWLSSSSSFVRSNPSFGQQQSELTSNSSLDNINSNPTQGYNRNGITQSFNLNADYLACGVDNFPPNMCKSSETENERMQTAGGLDHSSLPSGSGGYLEEDNHGSLGFPLESRRSSCKRKYTEVNVGESSSSGNRRSLQLGEASEWPAIHAEGSGSSLRITSLPEQVNPGINVQSRGFAYNTLQNSSLAFQSSQRNTRMRTNHSNQPESGPPHMLPGGTAARPSSTSSSQQSLRPVNSLGWRIQTGPGVIMSQDQPAVNHNPPLPRIVQPLRLNGVCWVTPGSSSSVISGNRDAARGEFNLRSSGRNIPSHLRLSSAMEMTNLVPSSTNRNLVSGNLITPGHNASVSGSATSSAVPLSAPSWVPPNPPPRRTRRLSDYIRRSLLSPVAPESGGLGRPLRSAPSTQETLLPGAGHQDHHQSNARSTQWMGRQGDGVLAIPYPFRNPITYNEVRRGRLVSEIRSVLNLMRQGEGGLRIEDVMILNQSGLFNIADIHDRHRDMRLDVDNMSYEELLALEERIGDVSTGLNEETILSLLKQHKFFQLSNGQKEEEPCCVCQEEYNDGDEIGKLDCGHDFHKDCIKQWLMHKNLCPICKTTGLAT